MRVLLLATLAVVLASPADARCIMSYCKGRATTPTRTYITDTDRRIVGDVYDPGNGRRVQIRDNDRRIIGYIEVNGAVTNASRQRIGTLDW